MGEAVRIYEVSLRDGLQNEPVTVRTEVKIALLHRLIAAGFRDIEVTSFVRPRMVPQLADAAELVRALPSGAGARFWALVPNPVGLERALDAGVRHVATVLSASETHNLKNVNRTVRESLAGLRKVVTDAVAQGVAVRSYVSTAFGCPYEGRIDPRRVVDLARELSGAGAGVIAVGDTTGMADPEQVKRLLAMLVEAGIGVDRIAVHFHDTRGTALANAYAAWQQGVRCFDGSISGIGGCPYAPGAAGNVATEDLVNLFCQMGLETGVDLEAACEAGAFMEEVLKRPLPGRYHQYWQGRLARAARSA